MQAACWPLEKPAIHLSEEGCQIQFRAAHISFPLSDYEADRDFPLTGNRASLSFNTGESLKSQVQVISKAVQERVATDEHDPVEVPDIHVLIKVDPATLAFIYLSILNNEIRWHKSESSRDGIFFDIDSSWEELASTATEDRVVEFDISRWYVHKFDSD